MTDTLSYSIQSDDGSSPIAGSQVEVGSAHINIATQYAPGTSAAVTGVAFAQATYKQIYIKSSANCTLVFTCTTGTVTINVVANAPFVWQRSTGYFPNPFSYDVTSCAITNTVALTLLLRVLQ